MNYQGLVTVTSRRTVVVDAPDAEAAEEMLKGGNGHPIGEVDEEIELVELSEYRSGKVLKTWQ